MWLTPPQPRFNLVIQSSSTLVVKSFFPLMDTECTISMKASFLVYCGHFSSIMLRINGTWNTLSQSLESHVGKSVSRAFDLNSKIFLILSLHFNSQATYRVMCITTITMKVCNGLWPEFNVKSWCSIYYDLNFMTSQNEHLFSERTIKLAYWMLCLLVFLKQLGNLMEHENVEITEFLKCPSI